MSNRLPDITIAEAACRLRVSRKTVGRWIKSGLLQVVKVGGRYRTTDEWIRAVIDPLPVVAGREKANVNDDSEAIDRLLFARYGIKKMPCP